MNAVFKVDRRDFLKSGLTGVAGLVLGFHVPFRGRASAQETASAAGLSLNAFIRVGSDDTVTFFIHKSEMGQGTVTSLAMLLAEELECDWQRVRTEFPGVDAAYGRSQGVFGSHSVQTSWNSLREAGARAREMLVQAAANRWRVDRSRCRAANNQVINSETDARLSFGELAEAASKLEVPPSVTLKSPEQFRLIGKPTKRLDTPAKVNGSAKFGLDVRVPRMLFASVERGQVIGGKVERWEGDRARKVNGVVDVVQIPGGIAVVAGNTGAALRGRAALDITWNTAANGQLNSEGIREHLVASFARPGRKDREDGKVAEALASSGHRVIQAEYEVPFLAHAPLEFSNCTADVRPDGCDVWAPTQMQSGSRDAVARITGLKPDAITIHTTFLGGGFGRRIAMDFIEDAVHTSKAVGRPVQVVWTREDDMRHSALRPTVLSRFHGGVDADGWPVVWKHELAGGLFGGTSGAGRDLAYVIPNFYADGRMPDRSIYSSSFGPPSPSGAQVMPWRSVDYSQNVFFVESFLDELAHLGGKDPLAVRERLLPNAPRHLAVLKLAAEKANWGNPPTGRSQGIALTFCFGTYVAEVAEVSVNDGRLKIHRVTAAVDCGRVVNPAGVRQQAEGGIVFGLAAALYGKVTFQNGVVQEDNYDRYELLRMDQMPAIDVHIVASDEAPSGMGEPAVPAAAPALCNAIFAATGRRLRKLPLVDQGLRV